MVMLYRDFDLLIHEDILLMYLELLLTYQYDQLNVEIPFLIESNEGLELKAFLTCI
jgi:hypothetical protein